MKRLLQFTLLLFCTLWISKEIALPLAAAAAFSQKYMSLVNRCDLAMDADWYERQAPAERKHTDSNVVRMLDCHDYDLLRKKMLTLGLPESYLAWLELRSLDIHQRSPTELISQHRFEYR